MNKIYGTFSTKFFHISILITLKEKFQDLELKFCCVSQYHNLSKGSLVQCYHQPSRALTLLCYSSMGQAGIGQLWILCLLLFPSSICIYGKYMHKKAAELSQRQYTTLDGNLEKIISKCVLLVSSSQITIEIQVNYHFPF